MVRTLAFLMILMPLSDAVWAQSEAHQDAREYGVTLGRAVWCDIDKALWRKARALAESALAVASYNNPERAAAKLRMKDMIDQTARVRPTTDCGDVARAFHLMLGELQDLDKTDP